MVCEYTDKEEVEIVVQEECETMFTLAHSAPIMKHSMARKLRYISGRQDTARAIVDGTYEIPPELEEAKYKVHPPRNRQHGEKDKNGRRA